MSPVDKATNPLNRETDWESIQLFCDQLSNEPEGCVHISAIFKLKCFSSNTHSEGLFTLNADISLVCFIYFKPQAVAQYLGEILVLLTTN